MFLIIVFDITYRTKKVFWLPFPQPPEHFQGAGAGALHGLLKAIFSMNFEIIISPKKWPPRQDAISFNLLGKKIWYLTLRPPETKFLKYYERKFRPSRSHGNHTLCTSVNVRGPLQRWNGETLVRVIVYKMQSLVIWWVRVYSRVVCSLGCSAAAKDGLYIYRPSLAAANEFVILSSERIAMFQPGN